MKYSILCLSLTLITTTLSPSHAVLDFDDNVTLGQRTISIQGPYTVTGANVHEINSALDTNDNISIHVGGDLIIDNCMVRSRGPVSIRTAGSFINRGATIQVPLLNIDANGIHNYGNLEFEALQGPSAGES